MIRKKFWVYEEDSFLGFEVNPKKSFRFRISAFLYRNWIKKRMSSLGSYLEYQVLKTKKDETFKQAYKRLIGKEEFFQL
jgi:hypothetical protein